MILNKKLENYWLILLSLPSWECGLKFDIDRSIQIPVMVTPFVGVWIEINHSMPIYPNSGVTPFVGVWIEISNALLAVSSSVSLPSWECGLKSYISNHWMEHIRVTPFVGVWIEIYMKVV